MAKINSKALDPLRYSCIQAEQQELKNNIPAIPRWHVFARTARINWRYCARGRMVHPM